MKRLLLIPLVLFLACEKEDKHGCLDSQACNYNSEASIDNNSCIYEIDCNGYCGGEASIDECGMCIGGTTGLLPNYLMDCVGVCRGNNNTCQLNFSLEDLNPFSETDGENIGPQFFNGKVTLYYFPFSET